MTCRRTQPNFQLHTQIFFSLYFTMTGLHALHMIIGLGLMSVMTWMAWKGRFSSEYYTPVEMSGLYWHFVDIVWIFLFPLLYLIDRSLTHGSTRSRTRASAPRTGTSHRSGCTWRSLRR